MGASAMPTITAPLDPASRVVPFPTPATTVHVPVTIAAISDQAVAETIKQVHDGYSNKIGARVSSGDGGSGRIFASVNRGQFDAAGYIGASRKGLEIGAEVTFDLNPK